MRSASGRKSSPATSAAVEKRQSSRLNPSSNTVSEVLLYGGTRFAPLDRTSMVERISLPVLTLRDTVLFPGVAAPITVGRLKSLRAVEAALRTPDDDRRMFAVAQRDPTEEPTPDKLYSVGVVVRVIQVQRFGAGLQLVLFCERR